MKLRDSDTPAGAVRRYVELVYSNPSNEALMLRYGAERYVDEDLIPRGIITTTQERAAILTLHRERHP